MNIPAHECDKCGHIDGHYGKDGERNEMRCLCEKCLQKALDEQYKQGKKDGAEEANKT